MFVQVQSSNKSKAKRSLVYGRGVNDAWYKTEYVDANVRQGCPFYRKWVAMLKRCYSLRYVKDNPSYESVEVCKDWLTFSKFRAWMSAQRWEGNQLDKDILGDGRLYSPETCALVSHATNCTLIGEGTGVTWCKSRRKYLAQCSVKGKNKVIGRYTTLQEASIAYKLFKAEVIVQLADEEVDIRVKSVLLEKARHLRCNVI